MPIPNPVYGLMVPFLCVVTLPLAIFAGITTTLAFSVLMFRVMVVYLDIAVSLVPQYLMGRSRDSTQSRPMTYLPRPSHQDGNHSPNSELSGSEVAGPGSGHNTPPMVPIGYLASGHRSPTRTTPHAHFASAPSSVISPSAGRRSRRGSMAGNSATTSVGTITPVKEESSGGEGSGWLAGGAGSSSFIMLKDQPGSGSNTAIVRDFEGVGGWRLASEDKTEDDDSDWANINSRLELPLERMRQQHQHQGQHHHRTPSGHSGTVTPGEGSFLMMKGMKGRGSEGFAVASDDVERDREVNWGSAVVGGNQFAGSSGRTSVSPNSSRVRIGQGVVTFTGVERIDGYFPTLSPKSARKGVL